MDFEQLSRCMRLVVKRQDMEHIIRHTTSYEIMRRLRFSLWPLVGSADRGIGCCGAVDLADRWLLPVHERSCGGLPCFGVQIGQARGAQQLRRLHLPKASRRRRQCGCSVWQGRLQAKIIGDSGQPFGAKKQT